MTNAILFSEDILLELAAKRIIAAFNPNVVVTNVMGRRGISFFQSRIREIRRSSGILKFIVFLDGDTLGPRCPADTIMEWFDTTNPNNIHVRFARYEVESWLLADRQNIANFLGISVASVPPINEATQNTKELLVQTARRSRKRDVVMDIVPQAGLTSTVGPAYNARMSKFIQEVWDIEAAATANDSLARACRCITSRP